MQFSGGVSRPRFWLAIGTMAIALGAIAAAQSPKAPRAPKPQVRDASGHLPLSFEENRGQTDARVKFLARGGGYSLFLTPTEAVLKLSAPSSRKNLKAGVSAVAFHPEDAKAQKLSVVRIILEGANPSSTASGVDVLPGRSNYFIGKDRLKWHTGVATYGGVRFRGRLSRHQSGLSRHPRPPRV